MNIFFDTNALLEISDTLFADYANDNIYLSSITLGEIEHIKTSMSKDNEVKYQARKLARILDEHYDEYNVITYQPRMALNNFEDTNDMKIIACAVSLLAYVPDLVFISNDICCKHLARLCLPTVRSLNTSEDEEDYTGYLEIISTDSRLADFYQNIDKNIFDLNVNQYLLIRDEDNNVVDLRCWTGETHRYLKTEGFDSIHFGKIQPYKNDPYQKMAFDSLWKNDLTMLAGLPGSGKTMLGLASLFSLLEHGKIDRIFIFVNPTPVFSAQEIGFLKGDKNQKILDGFLGSVLSTKIGSMDEVQTLIDNEQLILIPVVNCRGIDIPPNSGVFMTESQNSSADLMKLVLQRCGENVKVIIEGDYECQLDNKAYVGNHNGMKALSKTFRNTDFYGQTTLKTVHRSKICERAQQM